MNKNNKKQLETARSTKTILRALKRLDIEFAKSVLNIANKAVENDAVNIQFEAADRMIRHLNKCELRQESIKTLLTPDEFEEFTKKRITAGYEKDGEYLRHLAFNAVSFRSVVTEEMEKLFKDNNLLANTLDDLAEVIEKQGIKKQTRDLLVKSINHLKQNQESIRQEMVSMHNPKSAYLIAKEHLSLEDIERLKKEIAPIEAYEIARQYLTLEDIKKLQEEKAL